MSNNYSLLRLKFTFANRSFDNEILIRPEGSQTLQLCSSVDYTKVVK